MMTIKERKGKVSGLKVAIVGDIRGRTTYSRSNIYGLSKMGTGACSGRPSHYAAARY